jgi:hypothetical protein
MRCPYRFAVASVLCLSLTLSAAAARAEPVFAGFLSIPGNAIDKTVCGAGGCTPNQNRLSFGSDLYYDRFNKTFLGLADRGPGGGVIPYATRLQEFSLNIDPTTHAISDFTITSTRVFTSGGVPLNGLNPQLLNGSASTLGLSHDPEGVVALPNGNRLVSDEYGPAIREFTRDGQLVREFTTAANLIPRQADNTVNYVNGRGETPPITSGRQDNRGFEGLAISPDNSKAYAILQDPLVNEGTGNDGRRSRNVRLVEFDVAGGAATRQFVYQLEDIASMNARVRANASFNATSQGRIIGVSSIVALNNDEFLVLERDNRGVGVEPASLLPIASKRIYKISLAGATDVSSVSLTNTNDLPAGVSPLRKSLYLDIAAALSARGLIIPEKIEGLTIGPRFADGSYLLLLATDNDFSVTQTGAGTQFDVCMNGSNTVMPTVITTDNAFGAGCPAGQHLLPSYLYAFSANFAADGVVFQEQTSLSGALPRASEGLRPQGSRTAGDVR